ncbi:MAG: hypothetical protein AAGA35_01595 [Patescibacteria group bacterium]
MFTNCYRFYAPDGENAMRIEEGIPIVRKKHSGEPETSTLYSGDIRTAGEQFAILPFSSRANVTLLSVISRAGVSSHDAFPQPHFSTSNTWIGADGPGLLIQKGKHRDNEKRQLFRLQYGDAILFIDAHKEVTAVFANDTGEPPLRIRASDVQVANYVLGEARRRGENPSTRTWCYYALEELGCREQLDEFHSMFPDFRRK